MWPIYERQPSQWYQCHSYYTEPLSSGAILSQYLLNANNIVVLINVLHKNNFSHLGRQVLPEDSDGLFQAYLKPTEIRHRYLLLDYSLDSDDSHMFPTCNLPEETPTVINADIGNEAHLVKLPHFQVRKYCQAKTTYRTVTGTLWIILASVPKWQHCTERLCVAQTSQYKLAQRKLFI